MAKKMNLSQREDRRLRPRRRGWVALYLRCILKDHNSYLLPA